MFLLKKLIYNINKLRDSHDDKLWFRNQNEIHQVFLKQEDQYADRIYLKEVPLGAQRDPLRINS
jgi:hypothetical protein